MQSPPKPAAAEQTNKPTAPPASEGRNRTWLTANCFSFIYCQAAQKLWLGFSRRGGCTQHPVTAQLGSSLLPGCSALWCRRAPTLLSYPCLAQEISFLLQGLTSPCRDTPTHSCAQPWVGKAWQQPSGSSKDRARTSRKGARGQEHAAGWGPRGSNPCCRALWCPSLCEPQPQNTAGAQGDEAPSIYISPQHRAARCSPLFPLR